MAQFKRQQSNFKMLIKKYLFTILTVCLLALSIFVVPIVQAGGTTPSELDEFVTWIARTETSTLSPKEFITQLERMHISTKQSYQDKRYLFLRAYPDFADSFVKLRFQNTGKQPPKQQWALLDANLYFPDLSQAEINQLENELNQSIGKAVKHSNDGKIKTRAWMLGEYIEFNMRVDIAVGNVSFSYAVLQGDSPF